SSEHPSTSLDHLWLEVAQRRRSNAPHSAHRSTFAQANSFRDTSLLTLPGPDKRTASASWLFQPTLPMGWIVNQTTTSSSPTITHIPTGQIVENIEMNLSGQTDHELIKGYAEEYRCQPFMSGSDYLSQQQKSDLVTDSSVSEINSALSPEHIDGASPNFYSEQDPPGEMNCEATPDMKTNDHRLKWPTTSVEDAKCIVPGTCQSLFLTKLARPFLFRKPKLKNKFSRTQNIQRDNGGELEANRSVGKNVHHEQTNQVDISGGNNDSYIENTSFSGPTEEPLLNLSQPIVRNEQLLTSETPTCTYFSTEDDSCTSYPAHSEGRIIVQSSVKQTRRKRVPRTQKRSKPQRVRDRSDSDSPDPSGYNFERRKSYALLHNIPLRMKQKNKSERINQWVRRITTIFGVLCRLQQLKNLSRKKVPEYKMQQFNNPNSVFLHYGLFRIVWDRILLLFTFYIAFMVPYNVAFGRPSSLVETRRIIFDLLVEVLLIVDVILNFNTTYVNKSGQLVHKRRQLATNYVRGWFLLDGLAALPVDFVLLLIQSVQNARSHLVNDTSLLNLHQPTSDLLLNASRVTFSEADEGTLEWNTVGRTTDTQNRHLFNHANFSWLVH
ncbi:hypothetical protein P879_00575, partial [Paragonimus westermani]